MNINWKKLLICIAIPLLLGALAGFISSGSMSTFEQLEQPPLSPPGWLFPVVWTILYIMIGIASYLVVTSDAQKKDVSTAIKVYGVQLLFNFLWTIWFFNLGMYTFAFIWLVVLWLLILTTILLFRRISKPGAYLMIPYFLWVAFAGYLNLGIAILN